MMFSRFINYFIPPARRDIPEVYRKHQLVVTIIFLTALFDLQYSGLTVLIGMREGTIITFITFLVHFSLLFIAKMNLPLLALTNLYVLFGVASVDGCIFYSGGFNSPVLPWLASSPIVAMLMAGRATGFFWLIINTLTVIVFSTLSQNGYIFPKNFDPQYEGLFYTNCYTGLVMIIFLVSLVFENGKNTALRKLAEKSLLLAEEKRKTVINEVSQEIHDNVGQTLSIVKMNLHLVDLLKDSQSDIRLKDSLEMLGEAIKDLRGISHDLYNDEKMEKGLAQLLRSEVSILNTLGMFEVNLAITGESGHLNNQSEFMLSRVAKEAIGNIIRHAQATQINVRLIYESDNIILIIRDNGIGMDMDQPNSKGIGLKNMYSRVSLIGGKFHIESKPKKGTTITVSVPVNHNQHIPAT